MPPQRNGGRWQLVNLLPSYQAVPHSSPAYVQMIAKFLLCITRLIVWSVKFVMIVGSVRMVEIVESAPVE